MVNPVASVVKSEASDPAAFTTAGGAVPRGLPPPQSSTSLSQVGDTAPRGLVDLLEGAAREDATARALGSQLETCDAEAEAGPAGLLAAAAWSATAPEDVAGAAPLLASLSRPGVGPGSRGGRSRGRGRASTASCDPGGDATATLGGTPGGKGRGRGVRWTAEQDQQLREAVAAVGPQNWKMIASQYLGGARSDVQCLHRWQKVLQPGLVKGPWTAEEDRIIIESRASGILKWSRIAELIPGRIGKQCRERWHNHLDPQLKRGSWTEDEERILEAAQSEWGNSWVRISRLIGRSENEVKNHWYSASSLARRAAMATTPAGDSLAEAEEAAAAAAARRTRAARRSVCSSCCSRAARRTA